MLQEKILDELGNEMDSTSNRLDFVQVSFRFSFLLSDFNIAGNKDMNGKDLNVNMCKLMCVSLFMISEKSGNGDEEGQCKGPDDDDMWFAGAVHFPFYLGILHLVISECLGCKCKKGSKFEKTKD